MVLNVVAHRLPASRAGKTAAALLLGVAGFQGVLPDSLRTASAAASGVYIMLAAAAGTPWAGPALRRRVMFGTAALMSVGTLMNLASPSLVERMIWTPVSAGLAVLLWNAAKHDALQPRI
jgi:hypothetical protein